MDVPEILSSNLFFMNQSESITFPQYKKTGIVEIFIGFFIFSQNVLAELIFLFLQIVEFDCSLTIPHILSSDLSVCPSVISIVRVCVGFSH